MCVCMILDEICRMVERSELSPLEFLMSKQPRGNVRLGVGGNTGGQRVSNVFVDVKKFQESYTKAMSKNTTESSQSEVRISTVEAIRSISNWLYWRSSPYTKPLSPDSNMGLTFTNRKKKKTVDPDIRKLQDAVAAMEQAEQSGKSKAKGGSGYMLGEDYWTPSNAALPSYGSNENTKASSIPLVTTHDKTPLEEKTSSRREYRRPFRVEKFPIGTAIVAVFLVQYQASYRVASELNDHIGGFSGFIHS